VRLALVPAAVLALATYLANPNLGTNLMILANIQSISIN